MKKVIVINGEHKGSVEEVEDTETELRINSKDQVVKRLSDVNREIQTVYRVRAVNIFERIIFVAYEPLTEDPNATAFDYFIRQNLPKEYFHG